MRDGSAAARSEAGTRGAKATARSAALIKSEVNSAERCTRADPFRVSQGLAACNAPPERGLRPGVYLRGWSRLNRLVSRLVSTSSPPSLEVFGVPG
jgi:hypothetical protein